MNGQSEWGVNWGRHYMKKIQKIILKTLKS
jgi:hypothetical protein